MKITASIGKLLRRKCRHCFRFGKGMRNPSLDNCCLYRPPNNEKISGLTGNEPCCEWYQPRWRVRGTLKLYSWRFKARHIASRKWCRCIRIPLGSRRAPVPIGWQKSYSDNGGHPDGLWPECPRCGEMPYSEEQCQFCGQRFLKERTSDE